MASGIDIDAALLALLKARALGYEIAGLTDGAERPRRVSPFGSVFVHDGDPGEPEIDLSPPIYHYDRRITIELAAFVSSAPLREVLGIMAGAIAAAIMADRTLGGLADWVDVTAMEMIGLSQVGGQTQMGAAFDVIVSHSTTNPLT